MSDEVDILGMVAEMRMQRTRMVHKECQYKNIHEVNITTHRVSKLEFIIILLIRLVCFCFPHNQQFSVSPLGAP